MLLAIDIGNTNIALGLFSAKGARLPTPERSDGGQGSASGGDGAVLKHHWRMETKRTSTADEFLLNIKGFLDLAGVSFQSVNGIVVSNVVPPLTHPVLSLSKRYFNITPIMVGTTNAGVKIRYPRPEEVGADRLVNAAAAWDKYHAAAVIVDFGTATTFDYIDGEGAYLGGPIAPGIAIANEALFTYTSKLPRVDLSATEKFIPHSTVEAIQAGVYHGYVGLVDHLVSEIKREVGGDPKVIATGGLASFIAEHSETIEVVERFLTLEGLRIIFERNSKLQKPNFKFQNKSQ